MNTELDHLIAITKSMARMEAQLDELSKQAAIHAQSDILAHGKLMDKLNHMTARLDTYNDQLEEHMRRTQLLEIRAEKLKPVEQLIVWLGVSLRTVAIFASILGVLKLLGAI